ncbi:MAG: DUF1570 domain-containing protein [Phycisphaerales bacterium]|nr:MAG: DUF1570 domain-containing protein [Phycisphaerales bacterium]
MNRRPSSKRAWAVGALMVAVIVVLLVPASPASGQRKARKSWWDRAVEQKVGYYWFKSDLTPSDAERLAVHLNLMHEEYARRLASLPERAPEKLNVLMFADRGDYVRTLRVRYGVNAEGSGGMFFVTGEGSGLAFWTGSLPQRRIQHVIQHEGFHQFAYSRFGSDLPVWVNEGMAELFGQSMPVGRSLLVGQRNPRVLDEIKNAIELNEHVTFRTMLTMDQAQWSSAVKGGKASLQYKQAWSMVHFLVYAHSGRWRGDFERYLRFINHGYLSYDAFVKAFGTDDVESFEQRWKEYVLAAQPSAFITALERIEFLAEGAQELSRREISPESLDELREALRSIDFKYELNHHGIGATLTAADDAMFELLEDELTRQQPMFEVIKAKRGGMTLKDRMLEEELPTPPTISTAYLKPRNLKIHWRREKETNTFRYEIVLK